MLTVYKYPLKLQDHWSLEMPIGAKILSVDNQREQITLWALVDASPEAPTEVRSFLIRGTGHNIDEGLNLEFIGTVLVHDGGLVWHVFELQP